MTTYKVTCKYCGYQQDWSLNDWLIDEGTTLDEVIKYDLDYQCNHCQIPVRISEALDNDIVNNL